MNKRAQIPPQVIALIAIFGGLFLLSVIIPIFSQSIATVSCQNEKTQIANLESQLSILSGQLSSCQNRNQELESQLNDCLNKLNESEKNCDERLKNVTNQYELKYQEDNITLNFKQQFKKFSIIIFIPLTLSLFSFGLKIKFRKNFETTLFLIQLLIWIFYVIVIFVNYQSFFKSFFGF